MCAASSFVLSQDCLGCLESFGYVNQLSGDNLFKRMTNEVKLLSCLQLFAVLHYRLPGPSVHGLLHGKNIGVGSHSLLQGMMKYTNP